MQFKQKIIKIGNSFGIILPKQILDNQGLTAGEEINVSANKNSIIVSKDEYPTASPDVLRIADQVATEYGDVFEELSKK